jgi:hypothetical protein
MRSISIRFRIRTRSGSRPRRCWAASQRRRNSPVSSWPAARQRRRYSSTLCAATVRAPPSTLRAQVVSWDDITRPQGYHPFATFEAKGDKFYIDELGELHDETFTDKLEEQINK